MSAQNNPQFAIQRIYIKDLSFESPNAPSVFKKDKTPDLNVKLDTSFRHLEGDFWEASLKISANVQSDEETAFLCEVDQAGIFTLLNFTEEQREHILNSICPEILFPFARETIASCVSKGGFPQLLLAPINFENIYQEKKKQASQKEEKKGKK